MESETKILVIDDEESARYAVSRALSQQGHTVEEAPDGATALAAIDRFQPDVIVSDINMPGMDGLALLRRLNERSEPPLVVLITAYGSEQIAAEALRSGAYNYLSKPFELEDLRVTVRNAVEKQRLLRENRRYTEGLKRTLEELKESQTALLRAEKMASLSKLVAGIVHEINTPLGVLRSISDTTSRAAPRVEALLRGEPLPEGQSSSRLAQALTDAAAQSQVACNRVSTILKNLKDFAQLDRAQFRRAMIIEGIEQSLEFLRDELDDGIEIVRRFDHLPEIECSPRELNQLFMNLLLKARDSIRRHGGAGRIELRAQRAGDMVRLEITDNGEGIPAEHLPHVFDPGFRETMGRVGIDLGLPICYQIVKSHRGRIEVESPPGQGTRFVVMLPVKRPAEESPC